MRIAQILLPDASYFDRKSFQIDQAALAERHELVPLAAAQVANLYGHVRTPPPIAIPYVNAREVREAVATEFFEKLNKGPGRGFNFSRIATFGRGRAGVANMIEQTLARIHRFRDDIEWRIFDEPPTPADLSGVDVWIDPSTDDGDFDGFTAEALVAGKPVVASRTPINLWRLDKGMSGFLVPPRDPNELTHAILTALFKSEVALRKIEGARQTSGKFRPRQRVRALETIYESVTA